MTKTPINPDMLRWAMEDAGIGVDELVRKTKKPPRTVERWISGEQSPHGGDVQALAAAVGRSPLLFSLKKPPSRPSVEASFRKPFGAKSEIRSLVAPERAALRQAERQQKIAAWVATKQDEGGVHLPAVGADPRRAAMTAARWLQWSVRSQIDASSKGAAFSALRARIESQGILVGLEEIGVDACRGFSLPHKTVPMIVVNSSFDLGSVRSFTLLHELAHLLRQEQVVCDEPKDAVERWCDQFAAAFLMPADDIALYFEKYLKKVSVNADDIDSVRRISSRYKASYHAVAIRLRELGLADQDLVAVVEKGRLESKDKGGPGGEPQTRPVLRLRRFGAVFTRLVADGVSSGIISQLDGQKYLHVGQSEFLDLASRVRRTE